VPIYQKDGKTVFFIHIPKTGGGSIEEVFRKEGWEESRFFPGGGQQYQHAVWQEWQNWPEIKEEEVDEIFTVVRDPEERLRSDVRLGAQSPRHPIGNFEMYVDRIRHYITQYQSRCEFRDNHIRPQTDYFPPRHNTENNTPTVPIKVPAGYARIFKLPRFSASAARDGFLYDTENTSPKLPPIQIYYFEDNEHRSKILEKYNLTTSLEDFPQIGQSKRTEFDDMELPKEIIKLIYTTFAEDYKRFGYEKIGETT